VLLGEDPLGERAKRLACKRGSQKSGEGNRSKEKMMSIARVEEIQVAIGSLPYQEYIRLRQWFLERDWGKWDRQIEADSESGKPDFLIEEALNERAKGILREL